MNVGAAIAEIDAIFDAYNAPKHASTPGKVYELYCLANTVEILKSRGFKIRFVGTGLAFKASGGKINSSDPYFEFWSPYEQQKKFRLYTDIQFWSLGSQLLNAQNVVCNKKSGLHELDIVAVPAGVTGFPTNEQIALGIECKSNGKFQKWILKQVLGVRREMSLLQPIGPSTLSVTGVVKVPVPAEPASEFWLCYVDHAGDNYAQSAEIFGIEFKNWEP